MSQLDLLKNIENRQQLKEFLKNNNILEMTIFKAQIKTLNLDLNDVEINIDNNHRKDWGVVHIYWENKICNYKELGLYGSYRSDYYHINFDLKNNILIIFSDKTKIQISYTTN